MISLSLIDAEDFHGIFRLDRENGSKSGCERDRGGKLSLEVDHLMKSVKDMKK